MPPILCVLDQVLVFFAKTCGHVADHSALRRQSTKRPEPEPIAGCIRQRRHPRLYPIVPQHEPPQASAIEFMMLEERGEALDRIGARNRIRKSVRRLDVPERKIGGCCPFSGGSKEFLANSSRRGRRGGLRERNLAL